MKAIITVGISASGKTTWAEKFAFENNGFVLSRDNVRIMILENIHGRMIEASELWKLWNFKWEKEVNAWYTEILAGAIEAKEYDYIILADTNLNKQRRDNMVAVLENMYDMPTEIKVFDIGLLEAIDRDKWRPASVGEAVITRQWKDYQNFLNGK